jgi:hypothetical protein
MAAIATVRQITTPSRLAAGVKALWSPFSPAGKTRESFLDADNQLVERCLGGEEAAWEDLVKVHTRRVYYIF